MRSILKPQTRLAMNLAALFTFLTVMSITPGPNNLALAASGVNFGLRRTAPVLMGMTLGLTLQVTVLTMAMNHILPLIDTIKPVLAFAGCAYLLWLSWGMARTEVADNENPAHAQPMSFAQGLLFNWLNPKVWLMTFNMAIMFLPEHMPLWQATTLFALVTFIVTLPSIAVWAWGGEQMRRLLSSPRRLTAFNCTMAAALAGTACWLLVEMLPSAQLSSYI